MYTRLEGQGLNSGGIKGILTSKVATDVPSVTSFLNPDRSPKHRNVGGFVVSGNLGLLAFLVR